MNDLKFAFRQLLKSPGFTAVAVLTLALAIGANTAIFSLIYGLMLRWLPVPHPEQLRLLVQQTSEGPRGFSFPAYRRLGDQCRSLAGVGMTLRPGPTLVSVSGGDVAQVCREYSSAGYFSTLGLRPAAGRFFTPEEDSALPTMVVISYGYWQRHFNLSPAAIGATLLENGKPFTIVGVAPRGFSGIDRVHDTQVWFQISQNMWYHGQRDPAFGTQDHSSEWYKLLARLKPGVSDEQAFAELGTIHRRYLEERVRDLPEADREKLLERHVTLSDAGAGDLDRGAKLVSPLRVLMVLVALVLLLACANIGNMLLARTAARSREIAIRLALGAGRRHLVRQLLSESLVLAALGGSLGQMFGIWGAEALAKGYGITIDVSPDLRVLAFTALVSLGIGILFGLVPAFQAARSDVTQVLKGTRQSHRSGLWHPSRVLVVSQVALSIVLVVGAGLLSRTLAELRAVDTGFTREPMVLFELLTPKGYSSEADPAIWRLLDAVRQMPGVASATGGRAVPTGAPPAMVKAEGDQSLPDERLEVQVREVADGYFETLRTPLLSGRLIERKDCSRSAPKVAVLNESLARRLFGVVSPLGRYVNASGHGANGRMQIVGVVADARYITPRSKAQPEIFTAMTQFWAGSMLIRPTADPRVLMSTLPQFVKQSEPNLRVFRLRTLEEAIDGVLVQERMLAGLSGFFGLLALLLATLGIFGVISHGVEQRTREIGIRMALGAPRLSVIWMVLRETLLLLVAGMVVGIPVIFAGGRLVASVLYGLTPSDPMTLMLAALALSGAALLAGYLPARKAVKIDPMAALRNE